MQSPQGANAACWLVVEEGHRDQVLSRLVIIQTAVLNHAARMPYVPVIAAQQQIHQFAVTQTRDIAGAGRLSP